MKARKLTCIMISTVLIFSAISGCSKDKDDEETNVETVLSDTAVTGEATDTSADPEAVVTETAPVETSEATPTPKPESHYEFDPHPYSPKLAEWIPQEYWDAFNNLSDAVRAGETTFECSSQEAYDWAIDDSTIAQLLPAVCLKVSGTSNDGTIPYENGIGHIYYNMPIEDLLVREAEFEQMIEDILNSRLDDDDDDFEKILKLYEYMEDTYYYESMPEDSGDGYVYYTMMTGKGICSNLAGVYAYLLMEAGVDAISMGCFDDLDHEWTYVVLDGESYHVDPTWALKSYYDVDYLELTYFMMDDDARVYSGCAIDDLTVQLLPEFWLNRTDLDLSCTSDRFDCLRYTYYRGLDEENDILYYYEYEDTLELYYGN